MCLTNRLTDWLTNIHYDLLGCFHSQKYNKQATLRIYANQTVCPLWSLHKMSTFKSLCLTRLLTVKELVGGFNKEKTLVGIFSGQCDILRRFVDSLAPGSCSGELVLAIPGSGENKTYPPLLQFSRSRTPGNIEFVYREAVVEYPHQHWKCTCSCRL